jgi:hypothetical protein
MAGAKSQADSPIQTEFDDSQMKSPGQGTGADGHLSRVWLPVYVGAPLDQPFRDPCRSFGVQPLHGFKIVSGSLSEFYGFVRPRRLDRPLTFVVHHHADTAL